MQQGELDILKNEVTHGQAATHAMIKFIRPFLEEKRKVIYEGFQAISVVDTDGLMECKRQTMALDALEQDIQNIIDSGKMAAKSIADAVVEKENE